MRPSFTRWLNRLIANRRRIHIPLAPDRAIVPNRKFFTAHWTQIVGKGWRQ